MKQAGIIPFSLNAIIVTLKINCILASAFFLPMLVMYIFATAFIWIMHLLLWSGVLRKIQKIIFGELRTILVVYEVCDEIKGGWGGGGRIHKDTTDTILCL